MSDSPTILVIDDEVLSLRALTRLMRQQGFHVLTASTGEEGLRAARENDVHVALVDLNLPGIQGDQVIRHIVAEVPRTQCICITAQGGAAAAFDVLNAGAWDYFDKPISDFERFFQVLRNAIAVRELRLENAELRSAQMSGLEGLIGNSRAMNDLRRMVSDVAAFDGIPVLITGASGTGKERVAQALHASSERSSGPFIAVNCGAIPADLLESELFGYERGAFTGATRGKAGKFEAAEDGFLFLDEIGDMPLEMQVKLLRVLQEKQIVRVGANQPTPVNARIIAATHQELPERVKEGRFRQDLYYRLNVIEVKVPPLSERLEDVPLLAYYFLKDLNMQYGLGKQIDERAMNALSQHGWHDNNVRELQGALTRAYVRCRTKAIGAEHLALSGAPQDGPAPSMDQPAPSGMPMHPTLVDLPYREAKDEVLSSFTRWYLEQLLGQEGWNVTRAAERAGMLRENFRRLMRRYGVSRPA